MSGQRTPLPQWWDRLVSLLYPKTCVLCENVVAYDTLWCGCPAPWQVPADIYIPEVPAVWIKAPLRYSHGALQAIRRLKNEPHQRTIDFFTQQMAPLAKDLSLGAVVPVPANPSTKQSKGFDHAVELAKSLAFQLSIPCHTAALQRRADSLPQRTLSAKRRKGNAQASYTGTEGYQLPSGSILLVDDVCTTGATLAVCAAELLALGATQVYALTATYATLETHRG